MTDQKAIFDATMELVRKHVAEHPVPPEQLPSLIQKIHAQLSDIPGAARPQSLPPTALEGSTAPAVPIEQSVGDDYLICLEDGTRHRMLKRYLMRKFGMTPQQYREKWSLPADYPMTAPG